MSKFFKLFLLALFIVGCSGEPEPKPTTPLIVKTGNGDIRFNVEVARTPDELKTGLMNRTTLAFNSGMIFYINPVQPTAMWMKNTKIPLDMLFIAPDNTISLIYENTKPMSEDLLISRDPVRAVIELNAGQVRRHGIKIGDLINHALLNNMVDIKTPGPEVDTAGATPPPPAADTPTAPAPELPLPELKVPELPAPAAPEAVPAPLPAAPEKPALAPVQPKLPVPAPTI